MRPSMPSVLCVLFACVTLATGAEAQQFRPEYFSYDISRPVVQVDLNGDGIPVKFAFSAASFYPVRKMEIWIDGKKKSETYEVFANEGFVDKKLTLKPGSHTVGLYSGGFDGTVQHMSYTINVK